MNTKEELREQLDGHTLETLLHELVYKTSAKKEKRSVSLEDTYHCTDTAKLIEVLVADRESALLSRVKDSLPTNRPDAAERGELIPFDNDKKVEMHWLRKTQDAGFNEALTEVRTKLDQLSKEIE